MHSEQNVWLQDVITGLSKKSLQTWQRREDSRGASNERGVFSQSVESGRSKELLLLFILDVSRKSWRHGMEDEVTPLVFLCQFRVQSVVNNIIYYRQLEVYEE